MEPSIRIVTDSSCDLPQQLVQKFKIAVVPLTIHFGGETYEDGQISIEEFWKKATGGQPPRTSQPSIGAFEAVFSNLVEQGKQVLCLTLTGKHSGTFNAARVAAERFGEAVKVVDSLSLSLGLGWQALRAAQAAWPGRSMQEIVESLEEMRDRIHLTLVLNTLDSLRRGGRADAFISLIDRVAQTFSIKPIINMVDGQLRLLGVARSFQGGVKRMMSTVERLKPLEFLAVVHTRRQEAAEAVADWLAERTGFPREQVWVQETGATLASHGGSGVIGILAVPAKTA